MREKESKSKFEARLFGGACHIVAAGRVPGEWDRHQALALIIEKGRGGRADLGCWLLRHDAAAERRRVAFCDPTHHQRRILLRVRVASGQHRRSALVGTGAAAGLLRQHAVVRPLHKLGCLVWLALIIEEGRGGRADLGCWLLRHDAAAERRRVAFCDPTHHQRRILLRVRVASGQHRRSALLGTGAAAGLLRQHVVVRPLHKLGCLVSQFWETDGAGECRAVQQSPLDDWRQLRETFDSTQSAHRCRLERKLSESANVADLDDLASHTKVGMRPVASCRGGVRNCSSERRASMLTFAFDKFKMAIMRVFCVRPSCLRADGGESQRAAR